MAQGIDIAGKLETVTGRSHQKEIANFYCELAINEMMHSRPDAARPHLAEALAHHRMCVRANMLLGDLEAAAGRPEAAIEAWKRIESQNPHYLALIAERLYNAFKQRGKVEEGVNLLRGYLEKYPSLDLVNVVFQGTLESKGPEPAYRLVRDELRRMPTLLGLDKLLEAQLLDAPPTAAAISNWSRSSSTSIPQSRHVQVRHAVSGTQYTGMPGVRGLGNVLTRRTEERSCRVSAEQGPVSGIRPRIDGKRRPKPDIMRTIRRNA